MKRTITSILFGLLFLLGFGILIYPTVADQWNTYRQSQLISKYERKIEELEPEDFTEEWNRARALNDTLEKNNIYADVFGENSQNPEDQEYWSVLNIAGDGVMGYISIPKINVRIAIYHGTSEEVLQTGAGHLNGTKLPIGGESNHSVISAHRGLPSARLFTDIDQLVKGDMFYIHILDETLAYQVDEILDMVPKDDMDALEAGLTIIDGEDKITLYTCTPYGVNSHRLLVRGTRVPYNGEEDVAATIPETMLQSVQNYYMIYLILGLSITLLVIIIMRKLIWRSERK